MKRVLPLLPLLLVAGACAKPGPKSKLPEVSQPVEVAAAIQNAQLANHQQSDGSFASGRSTYTLRVRRGGEAVVTPFVRKAPLANHRAGTPLAIETRSIERGAVVLAKGVGQTSLGEHGEVLVRRGDIVETLQNVRGGVEQSWTFPQAPAATGDLVVRVAARGLPHVGTSEKGLHFADARGIGFRYGKATWVDAKGRATALAARADGSSIVLTVPARLVESSAYPAVLDPVIAPELGLDQPLDGVGEEIAVAFDGTNYLVVWPQPTATNGYDLYAVRVSGAGAVLDATPIPVSTAAGDQTAPAVAFDGNNYLVAWEDHRVGQYLNIYAARVSPSGSVLDPNGIPISTQTDHELPPAIAFDGTNYLIVWSDHRNVSWDIYGSRVSPDGVVLDPTGIAISTATKNQTQAAIAFDGTNYLVAWADLRNGTTSDIYAARVTTAGTVLDPAGILVTAAANTQSGPAVAFGGGEYLVVWQDLRNGTDYDIYGRRISTAGALLDSADVAISTGTGNQQVPAVVYDGASFLVAWEDYRSGTEFDVYGARVDVLGNVRDQTGFEIASATYGNSLALAHDAAGHVLAAYDAVNVLFPGASRLRARLVTDWAVLSVAKAGSGGGTVASSPAGVNCGSTCSAQFDAPTDVTLTATPDASSVFASWSDACSGTATTCTVSVDASKSVTAKFLALYPLSVSLAGTGVGTVTSSSGGINCGTTCSSTYVDGTTVTLTATPSMATGVESRFTGWSGACSGTGSCTVTVEQAKSVTATFTLIPRYPLTVALSGQGSVTSDTGGISCGTACSATYLEGTAVTLTPAGVKGTSVFGSWSGACAGTAACVVTMDAAKSVTSNFVPSYVLTVYPIGSGTGTVTGAGLACTSASSTCSVDVAANTTATITATPDANSIFTGWTGGGCSGTGPCQVTMNMAKYVNATFQPAKYALNVTPGGPGVGTVTGDYGVSCTTGSTTGCTVYIPNTYPTPQVVTLTATPDSSSFFKSWTGCASVSGNTCTVTMSTDRYVSTNFQPNFYQLNVTPGGPGVGTVTGPGINCTTGSTTGCTADEANGSTVTLTATPDSSSFFKSWSGCTTVSGNTCTVTMTSVRYVTPNFQPINYTLTVTPSGAGGGTVTGPGINCTTGSTTGCTADEANGSTVTLTATPDSSSFFKSWSGCTSVSGNTCTVTMTSARYVTPNFQPINYTLSVTMAGAGSGTVTGPGINCTTGATTGCAADEANGSTVTLTATPATGSFFAGWSACTSASGTTCTVAMTAAKYVTATFQPNTYSLSVMTSGLGSGTVTGPGINCVTGATTGCTADEANGSTVTLTASPAAGSFFASWSGCTSVSGSTCTATMTSARYVTATFQPNTFALTVTPSGLGSGTVTGPGINCTTGSTTGCTADEANGSTVTLTAAPSAGSFFASWSGCTSASGTTCTVTMTAAKYVTPTFQPNTFALNVTLSGSGSGTVTGPGINCTNGSTTGCAADETNGSTVTLTATPGAGSFFASWSGCGSVSDTTCTVTMTAAKYVSATFQPTNYALTVTSSGAGTGTVTGPGISCSTASTTGCAASQPNGSTVTLTASADPGSFVGGWSGCTSASGDTCTVTMTSDKYVTATFQPNTYPLSVSFSGVGSGTVTGPGISCATGATTGCAADEANGSTVTLTATADPGSTFNGWSGCPSTSGQICTVTMNAARYVTAKF